MKNKHHTLEAKKKIGLASLSRSIGSLGNRHTKESRKNFILPKKDTLIEVKIQNFLKQLGIEFFTHQYIKEIEHGYQCDILIPLMKMVIECDGNYWHNYPIGREIDHIRTKELFENGFKVLRLWEYEIKEMNLEMFKERIQNDF
jgi:very-short-patch-repair endonuclease